MRVSLYTRWRGCIALAAVALMASASAPRAATILFDATKHEMGGNADWIVDADLHDLNLPAFPCSGTTNESRPARFPTPPQAGITAATPETYWTGGISSWGVDLVKAGHTVETLPPGAAITFGDGGNPQDLSHYQLFIVVEPQNPFTPDEKSAILAFVAAGGGLFMVGDHETSDRDCDGWDSPHVWNDLTGGTSAASAGAFGIWFRVDGSATKPSEDWFDDGVDANVTTDPADPIIAAGPFGSGSGGLGFFGATSMELNAADNPTVKAHVWRTGQTHNLSRVTFASASYGSGRVAAIGDSSPADDQTGDPGDSLYPGWDKASGGVANRQIHLNACAWLLNAAPDTTPPAMTAGPAATFFDCSAIVSWTTDEAATSLVEYGATTAYGGSASASGLTRDHSVALDGLVPDTVTHYRAASSDAAGNGPTASADATFATAPAAAPLVTSGPSANVNGVFATVTWTTDERATSEVEYGTTTAYGSAASTAGRTTTHSVALAGLTPTTSYHYRALSTDACGNGPAASSDGTFTTGPASIDVGGWTIKQFTAALTYTLPPGSAIPAGGYLVVARDAARASFESFFPSMPAGTVFLDSNAGGSCANGCLPQVNGGETFELHGTSGLVDGPTISMSTNNAYQRTNPADPPGLAGSWTTVAEAGANPGQGAGAPGGAGVVINEMADASDYRKEFVELYYDAGSLPPDGTPPARITDLAATPLSSTSVSLTWTASGDDGTVGTAASYAVRRSAARILTETDFAAATPVGGVPAPQSAGAAEAFTVGGLTADTPYYFALRVSDEASNTAGISNDAGAVTALPGGVSPTSHLVISQIQTSGDGGTPADDEFVELYNPTAGAIALGGLSIQYKSATGTTYISFPLPAVTIASHGWYLVARSAYNGTPAANAITGSIQMAAAGGNVFLVNGTAALPSSSCSPSPLIIDKVGYGTGNCAEGTAASAPAANNAVSRKPGGTAGSGQDTQSNAADFQTLTPAAPHNAASTPATPPSSLGNVRATLYLTAGASGTSLDWARAAGATGYRVYRGTTPGFMAGAPAPWTSPSSNKALDPVAPASIFFYVVRATDGAAESED